MFCNLRYPWPEFIHIAKLFNITKASKKSFLCNIFSIISVKKHAKTDCKYACGIISHQFSIVKYEVRAMLSETGADPNEVIEDMLRHIEAELSTTGAKVITEHDVQRITNRIGMPDVNQISDKSWSTENRNSNTNSQSLSTEAKKKSRGMSRRHASARIQESVRQKNHAKGKGYDSLA